MQYYSPLTEFLDIFIYILQQVQFNFITKRFLLRLDQYDRFSKVVGGYMKSLLFSPNVYMANCQGPKIVCHAVIYRKLQLIGAILLLTGSVGFYVN